MTPPFVLIAVVYPGTSPQEMETQVSKVIEDGVASLDKVKAITSNSYEGMFLSFLLSSLKCSVDIVLQDVQRKVNEILSQLPEDAYAPVISKFALDEIPILRMGVTGNMATRDFYQFVKDKIQPRLAKLEGVGRITLVGGEEREIKVNLNSDKINFYGLSLFQVTQAINSANMDFPTGKLEKF